MIIENMAADLGLKVAFIDSLARGASHAYKVYSIPKRSGGARIIEHPSRQLKALQRWFLQYVISKLPVHPAAMAYQKNRSILDNASVHANSKYLLRMDFEKFFPSIAEADLRAYMEYRRSSLFADWTPYDVNVFCAVVLRKSRLAIGAPTSPALSNALCFGMDSAMSDLCARHGANYTRYADDLFFSTTQKDILRVLQLEVEKTVSELTLPAHLTINAAKTRHSSKRRARRVTGIVLGSDSQPHIGRHLKRKIRALIFKIDSLDSTSRSSLAGLLAYASGFDADFMNSLIMKYGHAVIRKARSPSAT